MTNYYDDTPTYYESVQPYYGYKGTVTPADHYYKAASTKTASLDPADYQVETWTDLTGSDPVELEDVAAPKTVILYAISTFGIPGVQLWLPDYHYTYVLDASFNVTAIRPVKEWTNKVTYQVRYIKA